MKYRLNNRYSGCPTFYPTTEKGIGVYIADISDWIDRQSKFMFKSVHLIFLFRFLFLRLIQAAKNRQWLIGMRMDQSYDVILYVH